MTREERDPKLLVRSPPRPHAQGQIDVDQRRVGVGQEGAPYAPLPGQGEKQRPAADEWLMIGGEMIRQAVEQFGEQSPLAAGPLQHRSGGRERGVGRSRHYSSSGAR